MVKVVQMSDGEMMNGSVSFELYWSHLCPFSKSQKICMVGNVETLSSAKLSFVIPLFSKLFYAQNSIIHRLSKVFTEKPAQTFGKKQISLKDPAKILKHIFSSDLFPG